MWDYWPWLVLLVGLHAGLVLLLVRHIGRQVRAIEQAIARHQRQHPVADWRKEYDDEHA
jgi:hypothetical protein